MPRAFLVIGLVASFVTAASAQDRVPGAPALTNGQPAAGSSRTEASDSVNAAQASGYTDPLLGLVNGVGDATYEIEMQILEGKDLLGSEMRDALTTTNLTVPAPWAPQPGATDPAVKRHAALAPATSATSEARDANIPKDQQKLAKLIGPASSLPGVTVLATPKMAVFKNKPAKVQMTTKQVFSYLVPIGNGKSSGEGDASKPDKPKTYERKYTPFQELGLTITLEANPVDGDEQFVDLSRFEVQVFSLDGRDPVQGLEELDVGKPIISTRSLHTTAKFRLGEIRVIPIPSGPKTQAVVAMRITKPASQPKIDGVEIRGTHGNVKIEFQR